MVCPYLHEQYLVIFYPCETKSEIRVTKSISLNISMSDNITVAPCYNYHQQQQNNGWLHFDMSSKEKYYEKLNEWLQIFIQHENN